MSEPKNRAVERTLAPDGTFLEGPARLGPGETLLVVSGLGPAPAPVTPPAREHCWHSDPSHGCLQPQYRQVCCHCGKARLGRQDAEPGHGPHLSPLQRPLGPVIWPDAGPCVPGGVTSG